MPRTLVIVPALNEEQSIARVIHDVLGSPARCDVLVIDDGSTDGTVDAARAAGATVVSLPYNMGVGSALRTGFRYACRYDYDRVVQCDADGQHRAEDITRLVEALEQGADLAIGSRFMAGDGHYEVENVRGAAMRILRVAIGVLIGRRVLDTTSGFRAFSGDLVRYFSRTYPREFLSDTVEALLLAGYGGFRIVEVPVTMRHRELGEPSHRSVRLMYHYIRVLVVMVLTASVSGRRQARKVHSS